jgi:hypothetical protein
LPSVDSRTIRTAAWLESSFGFGVLNPITADPGWTFLQCVRKLASTFFSSETVGFSAMRSRENTPRQSEQYQTKGVLVRSMNETGMRAAILPVSHSSGASASPVEIKRHHYRPLPFLDTFASRPLSLTLAPCGTYASWACSAGLSARVGRGGLQCSSTSKNWNSIP